MLSKSKKRSLALRRKRRVRKKIHGSSERPRLSVYRSNKHIYSQVVDDVTGRTIVSASTLSRELKESLESTATVSAAAQVGNLLARKALDANVTRVVFDRNRYRYHGRVRAVATAAREAGLDL